MDRFIEGWKASNITIADAEATLHLHLSKHMPPACVTSSGGKSLHGWYIVFDLPESDQRACMERAVALGADRATWARSQFVRMPDGYGRTAGGRPVSTLTPKIASGYESELCKKSRATSKSRAGPKNASEGGSYPSFS